MRTFEAREFSPVVKTVEPHLGPYSSAMHFVASSGKSTVVSIRVPVWRVKRRYAPAGAIHACTEGEHVVACGIPLSMLIAWPDLDFDSHQLPHGCPNCAVALARTQHATSSPPADIVVPGARRAADDLAHDPR